VLKEFNFFKSTKLSENKKKFKCTNDKWNVQMHNNHKHNIIYVIATNYVHMSLNIMTLVTNCLRPNVIA